MLQLPVCSLVILMRSFGRSMRNDELQQRLIYIYWSTSWFHTQKGLHTCISDCRLISRHGTMSREDTMLTTVQFSVWRQWCSRAASEAVFMLLFA